MIIQISLKLWFQKGITLYISPDIPEILNIPDIFKIPEIPKIPTISKIPIIIKISWRFPPVSTYVFAHVINLRPYFTTTQVHSTTTQIKHVINTRDGEQG